MPDRKIRGRMAKTRLVAGFCGSLEGGNYLEVPQRATFQLSMFQA